MTNNVHIKTAEEIEGMRIAGRLASEVLDYLTPFIQVGVTTKEIDKLAHDYITQVQNAIPAPLNYTAGGSIPFPCSICTSVNHVVCHGIPNEKQLKNGDTLNVDVTVIKDGWHGDTSRMFMLGEVSKAAQRLAQITYEAMYKGIAQVRPGARLGDIGYAIQSYAEKNGYSVVREYCGHGVGKKFHEAPQILHYGKSGEGEVLVEGMTFTIEPMINQGRKEIKDSPARDGWTIVTKDRSLSAQWEHTLAVTANGYEIMTISKGSPKLPEFISSNG